MKAHPQHFAPDSSKHPLQKPAPPTTEATDFVESGMSAEGGRERPPLSKEKGFAAPSQPSILALQRTIGNAALTRRFYPSNNKKPSSAPSLPKSLLPFAARTFVQRFASSEHRSLGVSGEDISEGALFEGSPALTYGEIIALSGDFYQNYEQMASPYFILADMQEDRTSPDTRQRKIAELNALKNLFEIEARARATGNSALPPDVAERILGGMDTGFVPNITGAPDATGAIPAEIPGAQIVTEGRYGNLALDNFLHFSFGGENVNAWKDGHKQAMQEAFTAGLTNDQGGRVRAMARNAASNHYLTDAFSSGHMRVPRRPADVYYRNLLKGAVDGLVEALVNQFPASISFSVPLDQLREYLPDWVPDLPNIPVDIPLPLQDMIRSKTAGIAASLRGAMDTTVGPVLGGLVSKWLHDKENERGLIVSNAAGGLWQAFGDEEIDREQTFTGANTTNRAEAQKAVDADVAEVRAMFELGQAQGAQRQGQGGANSTPAIPSTVLFGFDQPRGEGDLTALSGGDASNLDALATYMQTVDGITIDLTGWADSRGRQEYNVPLSSRRISAVRAYLMARGVPESKFGVMTPQGEPVVVTSAATHAQFRRVDITLQGTPTPRPPTPTDQQSPDTPMPAETAGPYAAEQFLPHVESSNPLLEPYEWCDPNMDAALKGEVSAKARDMLSGLLKGLVTQNLPQNYPVDIEIPVPFMDNPHVRFEIPIRDWLSEINNYVEPAVDAVLTDTVFTGVLDGACSLAEVATPVQ